jgi:hypothetical protein
MVATMHFEGAAARWSQSLHHRIWAATWTELCSWIYDKFSCGQHDSLIRQLFHIKQSEFVHGYIDRFTALVDQLISYGQSKADHHYFTTHFIDDLRDDIKSIVLAQRPVDHDTASTLALLQEEANFVRCRDFKKTDYTFKSKLTVGASLLPLPPPPPKLDKAHVPSSVVPHSTTEAPAVCNVGNKVVALRSYRKDCGLYQYCAQNISEVTNVLQLSNYMQYKNYGR